MKKLMIFTALQLFCLVLISRPASAQIRNANVGKGNLRYVDPRIGNVGALLEPTRPTTHLPNQLIRMYPERENYLDDQVQNFPLTIVSHRVGEVFSIKPSVMPVTLAGWDQRQGYDHDLEITRPWYYSTYLVDDDVTVEFTPEKKAGIFRFKFPTGAASKNVLFGIYNDTGSYTFEDNRVIRGEEVFANDVHIFLYGQFGTACKHGVMENGNPSNGKTVQGPGAKAWVGFPDSVKSVEFRYAISYLSPLQAKANFDEQINGRSFLSVKNSAEHTWLKVVQQIQFTGGTLAQKRSFYTALYRCNERMVDITEDHHYYSGYDKKIHATNGKFYVDDWIWDTYLALHPLRAILNPLQERDMVNSYVNMYEQSGWMPTFPLIFGDNPCMNGFHSSIMLLDDYRKGIKADDPAKAYEGMLKNANEATMAPWANGPKTSLEDFYDKNGYYPALKPGEKETVEGVNDFEKRQAVAVTLGGSYDDWAVGQMAKELGKTADYQKFSQRGLNYKNLWNADIKMFMPKDAVGDWINIDPKFDGGLGGRDYFDENNGWTYMWQVPHDIPGLISLNGGKANFESRLDQLFREPLGRAKYEFWNKFPDATGLVGQFSMGNEPSFFIPYLYNFTDAPWKTQKRVRFLLDVWFKDNIFGIPGDEDGGGMSAFVVFSSMGFYPVTPGIPVYTIGSPVFKTVTIKLQNGKQFRLIARNCSITNKYIQSAKFDGKPLNTPWFTHQQLVNGGKLELEMGPKPNKKWGL